ncbi:MAG: Glu/Leu/Phe/Val family dehydrogenase, partial [Opitutaceae bacterium]
VVQGFGNVGAETALAMTEYGAKVIGISDVSGGCHRAEGIDVARAIDYQRHNRSLHNWDGGDKISNDELLELPCTVLIPAALDRVITAENAPRLRCRILAEAANGPTTNGADRILAERGDIEIIPDVLCNAGGVIVSYFEWIQDLQSTYWGRAEVLRKLEEILDRAQQAVEKQKSRFGLSRRLAALTLGIGRVAEAKAARGLFP